MDRLSKLFKSPAVSGSTVMTYSALGGLFKMPDPDQPLNPEELAEKYGSRERLSKLERLQLMWRLDEFGNTSPELREVNMAGLAAGGLGYFYGSVVHGTAAFNQFKLDNRVRHFGSFWCK